MVAGPEVARVIEEFHDEHHHWGRKVDTRHHDQTSSVQASFAKASFAKDVRSLVSAFEDLGNPFEEESTDLLVLDTKEIADLTAVKTVQNVKKIGQDKFKGFTNPLVPELF